ncbi:hypothetical protein DFH09DRAFT_1330499 [Mycena vulgaris]|nr:hypothetical protein DFH09DRAFT_1330499 [Mycena vulgaris]
MTPPHYPIAPPRSTPCLIPSVDPPFPTCIASSPFFPSILVTSLSPPPSSSPVFRLPPSFPHVSPPIPLPSPPPSCLTSSSTSPDIPLLAIPFRSPASTSVLTPCPVSWCIHPVHLVIPRLHRIHTTDSFFPSIPSLFSASDPSLPFLAPPSGSAAASFAPTRSLVPLPLPPLVLS